VALGHHGVPIGNAGYGHEKRKHKFRQRVFEKLREACPDDKTHCSYDQVAIHGENTVVNGQLTAMKILFDFDESLYTSPKHRDRMLLAAVASWHEAGMKRCDKVEFRARCDIESDDSTLKGQSIDSIGNSTLQAVGLNSTGLKERSEICDECGTIPRCDYDRYQCSSIDLMSKSYQPRL
jgi:hypothetical protein